MKREPVIGLFLTPCILCYSPDPRGGRGFINILGSHRAAQTGGGSSRCSDSSSPSSCLVCTDSRAVAWTAGPSWRSHSGSWPRAPASYCRLRPRTAAGSADEDCRCRRWSRSLPHAGSLCRPWTEPEEELLKVQADRRQTGVGSINNHQKSGSEVLTPAGQTCLFQSKQTTEQTSGLMIVCVLDQLGLF